MTEANGLVDDAAIPRSGVVQDLGAPVCFIDTEYTTLDPWRRRPWEIAVIRRDPGVPDVETTFIISDVDLSDADPKSLDVGHFFERHPAFGGTAQTDDPLVNYVPEVEAAEVIEALTRGCHVVAAVPDPDVDVLREMLRRHGLRLTTHYHLMDIENIAIGYLKGLDPMFTPKFPLKSDDLSKLCGLEPPDDDTRHTAMGDARWVRDWWDAIFQ